MVGVGGRNRIVHSKWDTIEEWAQHSRGKVKQSREASQPMQRGWMVFGPLILNLRLLVP